MADYFASKPSVEPTSANTEYTSVTPGDRERNRNRLTTLLPERVRHGFDRSPAKTNVSNFNLTHPGAEKTASTTTRKEPAASPGEVLPVSVPLDVPDPKTNPTVRVHDPLSGTHSVDVVAVYLFYLKRDGGKCKSDLAMFESRVSARDDNSERGKKIKAAILAKGGAASQEPASTKGIPDTHPASSRVHEGADTGGFTMGTTSVTTPALGDATTEKPSNKDKANERIPKEDMINWLHHPKMLRRVFPDARVITVGFDIHDCLDLPLDLGAFSRLLADSLEKLDVGSHMRPLIFIGHAYGGLIIEQLLVEGATATSENRQIRGILGDVAGLFLFSCPVTGSDNTIDLLAENYGITLDRPFFSNMRTGSSVLRTLTNEFNSRVLGLDGKVLNRSSLAPRGGSSRVLNAAGLPVIQFLSKDDVPSQQRTSHAREPQSGRPMISRLEDLEGVVPLVGRSFRDVARFTGPDDKGFRLLSERMAWVLQARRISEAATDSEKMSDLLNEKPPMDVNLKNGWGETALHIAARNNNAPVARLLLKAPRVDPSPTDLNLDTPLHYAVRQKNYEFVVLLVDEGADVTAVNSDSHTPITLAQSSRVSKRIVNHLYSQPLRLVEGTKFAITRTPPKEPDFKPSGAAMRACRGFLVTVTEIFNIEGSEWHWKLPLSVKEVIYASKTMKDMLKPMRPKKVENKTPVCRWVHIHQNNMLWVKDLFATLGMEGSIFAESGDWDTALRGREITPHVAHVPVQDNAEGDPAARQPHSIKGSVSKKDKMLALFVPYVSYDVNEHRMRMIEFIKETYKYSGPLVSNPLEESTVSYEDEDLTEDGNQSSDALEMGSRSFPELLKRATTFNPWKNRERIARSSTLPATQFREARKSVSLGATVDSIEAVNTFSDFDIDEEDKALVEAYLCNPPALHFRRTLDQYYYHMLSSTAQRDRDQVVTRWHRYFHYVQQQTGLFSGRRRQAQSPHRQVDTPPHNILMVDQLWLWRFRDNDGVEYVVSSFPDRSGVGPTDEDNLRQLVLDRSRSRHSVRTADDLFFRIVGACCNIFDRCQSNKFLQFIRIFEESIGIVTDGETVLSKVYRDRAQKLQTLNPDFKGYEKLRKKLLKRQLDIRKETKLLVETKDIIDEINIIQSVLFTQQTLLSDSRLKQFKKENVHYERTSQAIAKTLSDFERMKSQAQALKKSLDSLMDLKQKAANAWEARFAREGADATARQGKTMLVFTAVTIVFLPLSFMSSFFALDVSSFPQDARTGETNWPLGLVSAYIFGISTALIIPLLWIAMNAEHMSTLRTFIRKEIIPITKLRCFKFISRFSWLESITQNWVIHAEQRRDNFVVKEARDDSSESDVPRNSALDLDRFHKGSESDLTEKWLSYTDDEATSVGSDWGGRKYNDFSHPSDEIRDPQQSRLGRKPFFRRRRRRVPLGDPV